jgi:hypothetical protein
MTGESEPSPPLTNTKIALIWIWAIGMQFVLGAYFFASLYGLGRSIETPNPETGHIYTIYLGRRWDAHYLTWDDFVIYQICMFPLEAVIACVVGYVLILMIMKAWRSYQRK